MHLGRARLLSFATLLAGSIACEAKEPVAAERPSATAPPARAAAPALDLFDRVVQAGVVFPDPAQRALYDVRAPETVRGDRVYAFMLKPQPGMVENRHFRLLSIAIAPAPAPAPAAGAGPNGAFRDFTLRTDDGHYRLRVSEGMLLPDAVDLPEIDLERVARTLAARYSALTAHP